jgi:signal transduction histidine kinase
MKGEKRNIELRLNFQDAPETITADESKLKQIIYNLLSNAVKFTPAGGQVCLQAKPRHCFVRPARRKEDPKNLMIVVDSNNGPAGEGIKKRECVEISVIDTGVGLEAGDHERIFRPLTNPAFLKPEQTRTLMLNPLEAI